MSYIKFIILSVFFLIVSEVKTQTTIILQPGSEGSDTHVAGKIILNRKVNDKHFEIDLIGYESGIYFLRISDNSGKSRSKKVMHY